jgi:hypothetical protein
MCESEACSIHSETEPTNRLLIGVLAGGHQPVCMAFASFRRISDHDESKESAMKDGNGMKSAFHVLGHRLVSCQLDLRPGDASDLVRSRPQHLSRAPFPAMRLGEEQIFFRDMFLFQFRRVRKIISTPD